MSTEKIRIRIKEKNFSNKKNIRYIHKYAALCINNNKI